MEVMTLTLSEYHGRSFENAEEVKNKAVEIGCFACKSILDKSEFEKQGYTGIIETSKKVTLVCPRCMMDTVTYGTELGEITEQLLEDLNKAYIQSIMTAKSVKGIERVALINGKEVILDIDSAIKADAFHKSRLAFAYVNETLKFNRLNDGRDHQHWLLQDFGISAKDFEGIPRGYIRPGRIQFFQGSDFRVTDYSVFKLDILLDKYQEFFGSGNIEVCNGVHIGKVGDVWKPIDIIGTYNI